MRRLSALVTLTSLAAVFSLGRALPAGSSPGTTHEVTSDFNNDGFADLAVGVPFENVGSVEDAGAVNVLYGSDAGLQTSAPADQFWHQDSPGVGDRAETGDNFGWSLVTGDFNDDGFADLAVGVPFEGVESAAKTVEGAGAVNVLYGSSEGLQATDPEDQFWHQDSTGVEDRAEADDGFGLGLASGDFNDDGFSDLAVGVTFEGVESPAKTVEGAGAVNVLYGSDAGLQTSAPPDQLWHQDSPNVEDTAEELDNFGWSVAAGDFNDDGFSDLATSVVDEDLGSVISAGAVSILYGSADGLQAVDPNDQLWHQDSPDVEDSAEEEDFFGELLATGDFNDDGFADLASSVYPEDVGTIVDAGAVSVLYGSADGLQAIDPDDQLWHQDSPDVEDVAEAFDHFGFLPSTGDFNKDGFDDLAVGVLLEDIGDTISAGAASVLYGSKRGLQATDPADQFWNQDSPDVEDVAEERDWFGSAAGAADFNHDGFIDLAIGVQQEDLGAAVDAGAAHVLYGSADGLQTASPEDQFWHQDSPDVEDTAEDGDNFGWIFGAGASVERVREGRS